MLVAIEYKTVNIVESIRADVDIWIFIHFISFGDFANKYENVLISTVHIHIMDNLSYEQM